jgi:hypothetical protein
MKIKKIIIPAALGACLLLAGLAVTACFPDMVVVEPPTLTLDDYPSEYDDWLGSPSAWGSGDLIVDLPRSYRNPSEPAGASLEELYALRESINKAEKAKKAAAGGDRSPKPKESDDHHP